MIAEFVKALLEGRPIPITKRDAVQTLTGSGFRPGQTIDAMTKTLLDAFDDDTLDWDNAGALAAGTFIGEVGASFLQPLTMGVDLSRAMQEDPDLAYKDWKPDPNYGMWDAFRKGFTKPFGVKGFGFYDQKKLKETISLLIEEASHEELRDPDKYMKLLDRIAALEENRIYDRVSASRQVSAKRGSPLLSFLGFGTTERDTPEQFFLKKLRLDDYIIGGRTGVGSIDAQVDDYLNDYVPELVRAVMDVPNLTEREQKALLMGKLSTLRAQMQGHFLQSKPLVHQYYKFRRFRGSIRSVAMEKFRKKYGRDKDWGSLEDLVELNAIASAWDKVAR